MRYAPLVALVALIGACGRPAKPAPEAPTPPPSSPVQSAEKPAESLPSEAALSPAEAMNAFGFDLYAKLKGQKGNLAFSPASIMAALAMTQGGAKGETRAEMAKVLHLDATDEEASFEVGKAFGRLGESSPGLKLKVANRLFGEKSFSFEQVFLDKTKTAFGAPLEALDFRKATERSRTTINDWVAKETERKIENLIPQGGVNGDTRLVLVNAIYFLGKWEAPFEKEKTAPAPFHLADGKTKDVPMMHESGRRLYGEKDGAKILELGYRESELAMTFVLPNADSDLAAVEAKLSPEQLSAWVSSLEGHQTEVTLPKFRIKPAEALGLGRMLRELGMTLAFDPGKADFSGIAKAEGAPLSIGEVFHKAFVAVDEAGTEAAAATAVMVRQTSMIMPEHVKEFRADRPFLFFLRHKPSGAVLFVGRVAEPG